MSKPSEYGVREGDTQTATTYLILLAWRDDLMERLRWAEGVLPTRHYAEFIDASRPWRKEAELLLEEMAFCATLLGDTARDLFNIWEDARAKRELEIKRVGLRLILNESPGEGKKNPYVFNPKGKPVKFRKPRSIEIADVLITKGNK